MSPEFANRAEWVSVKHILDIAVVELPLDSEGEQYSKWSQQAKSSLWVKFKWAVM